MREFRAGNIAIKPGSPEEQAVADYRERGLSYTETTLLINRQCLQDGRPTVTCSAVRTCEIEPVDDQGLYCVDEKCWCLGLGPGAPSILAGSCLNST